MSSRKMCLTPPKKLPTSLSAKLSHSEFDTEQGLITICIALVHAYTREYIRINRQKKVENSRVGRLPCSQKLMSSTSTWSAVTKKEFDPLTNRCFVDDHDTPLSDCIGADKSNGSAAHAQWVSMNFERSHARLQDDQLSGVDELRSVRLRDQTHLLFLRWGGDPLGENRRASELYRKCVSPFSKVLADQYIANRHHNVRNEPTIRDVFWWHTEYCSWYTQWPHCCRTLFKVRVQNRFYCKRGEGRA